MRDVACIVLSPSATPEAIDRASALITEHRMAREDVDAMPAALVGLAELAETDRIVTVECDGAVVRHRITRIEDRGARRAVYFGARGMSALNAPAADRVLIERGQG